MKDKNSVPARIDPELNDVVKDIQSKNDINFRQASKEAARIIKKAKNNGNKIVREIKF